MRKMFRHVLSLAISASIVVSMLSSVSFAQTSGVSDAVLQESEEGYDIHDLNSYDSENYKMVWSWKYKPYNQVWVGATSLPELEVSHDDNGSMVILKENVDFKLDHIEEDSNEQPRMSYGKTIPSEPGSYYACYEGIGDYYGSISIRFTVVAENDITGGIGGWKTHFLPDDIIVTTDKKLPQPEIYRVDEKGKKTVLVEGVDYELVNISDIGPSSDDYGTVVPTWEGVFEAYYKGIGKYTGIQVIPFEVKLDFSKAKVTLDEMNFTYDGKIKKPVVKSVLINGWPVDKRYYTVVEPAGCTDVGTYKYTVTGKEIYDGSVTVSFTINPGESNISATAQVKSFSGKPLAYSGKVKKSGSKGKVTYTYYSDAKGKKTVKPANVKNAGTYYVCAKVAADKNYKEAKSRLVKFTIAKAINKLKVSGKQVTLKQSKLKKKAQTVKAITTKNAKGAVSFKLVSVNKRQSKKYFSISAKTGKITVKKGIEKGTYVVRIKVKANGNKNYKAITKTISVKVVVK